MLSVFFFKDTATTEIYTLSLHDALPIFRSPAAPVIARFVKLAAPVPVVVAVSVPPSVPPPVAIAAVTVTDRKSTRLNSSHVKISYAVFCLKKKKNKKFHLH